MKYYIGDYLINKFTNFTYHNHLFNKIGCIFYFSEQLVVMGIAHNNLGIKVK